MKCPKCSYVSFDYNKVCPKCDKDIAAERERMNLLSYRPNPPSLLGALIGENDEATGVQIEMPGGSGAVQQERGISPEDSQVIEAMEVAFKDSQEIDIQLEPTPGQEAEESLEEVDLSGLDPETMETEIQAAEPDIDLSLDETAEELSIDFEDSETGTPAEQAVEEEITLVMDDLEPSSLEGKDEGLSLDLESLDLDLEPEEPDDKSS